MTSPVDDAPTTTPESEQPATDGLVDGDDVDAVALAVRSCPGVSDLYSGRLGELGTYLPGRRVAGILVDPDRLTVHVRSRWAVPASDLLTQLRAALAPLRDGRTLEVVVSDIDDPSTAASSHAAIASTTVGER